MSNKKNDKEYTLKESTMIFPFNKWDTPQDTPMKEKSEQNLDKANNEINKFIEVEMPVTYGTIEEEEKEYKLTDLSQEENYPSEVQQRPSHYGNVSIRDVFESPTLDRFKKSPPKSTSHKRMYLAKREEMWQGPANPSEAENFDITKKRIRIQKNDEETILCLVAVNVKSPEKNSILEIKCQGGSAIGGYAFDLSKDAYLVCGVDYVNIGIIPFSFSATMDDVGEWRIRIPIPPEVIDKVITAQQREIIEAFSKKRPNKDFRMDFIQMTGCC